MLSPLHSAQLTVAGLLLAFALLHFLIGIRHPDRKVHITFALSALTAAAESVVASWRYHPASPLDVVAAIRWSTSLQFTFGVLVVWFVHFYGAFRDRWAPWVLTAATVVAVTLQLMLPFGLTFDALPGLRQVLLPWGEQIAVPVGHPTRALLWAHLTSSGLVCYLVSCAVRLWKRGDRDKALALSIGYAPLILLAWPHGILVNRGLISPPHIFSFAFLALVLLMSLNLVRETVRVAALVNTVEAQNRRWSTLLDSVQLLVASWTAEGVLTYVNPFFLRTAGYSREELLGRRIDAFLEIPGRSGIQGDLGHVSEGSLAGHLTSRFRRKDGSIRSTHWSTVRLFNEDGSAAGFLSIGSDFTEQELAEEARDKAYHRLEELAARLEGENLYLKEEIGVQAGVQTIVGDSPAIRYVVHQIHLVANTKATVLIEGETGVGKELVARAIHELSDRSSGPFIGLNCAALSPALIESELFGAEKGAYTGADKPRKGRFELADGGTLFLDEAAELALDLQAKLLRVLQESEFERLGGQRTHRVDVRVIAATNRNLQAEIAAGRFREDLYYRLAVYPITVPPLRERRADIPALVRHIVAWTAARHAKKITEVSNHAMKALVDWDWPGNVRELANVIERAVISSSGSVLNLPADFGRATSPGSARASAPLGQLSEIERNHILGTLEHTNWKIYGRGGAAEILGMHPNTLRSRMAKIGLKKPTQVKAR